MNKASHCSWLALSTGFGIFQPSACLCLPGPLLLLLLHHDCEECIIHNIPITEIPF